MKQAATLPHTEQQATRATWILGVIFDDFTRNHNMLHLGGGNHAIRVGHLANRMGQIQYALSCSPLYLLQNGLACHVTPNL